MCNDAVLSWITNSVSKEIVNFFVHMEYAAQAWIYLEIRFGGRNGSIILQFKKRLTN